MTGRAGQLMAEGRPGPQHPESPAAHHIHQGQLLRHPACREGEDAPRLPPGQLLGPHGLWAVRFRRRPWPCGRCHVGWSWGSPWIQLRI